MNSEKIKYSVVVPVLMSFFVMSFIDLVGTGVDELRSDSDVPAYLLQIIPFVAFIWFFILSVPVGIWQDRLGAQKTLYLAVVITAVGLFIPVLGNSFPVILLAFSLLGIGNTILQVSANPLLAMLVPERRMSSFLSLSQFIKSLGSMIGPFVAAVAGPFLARLFGDTSAGAWRWGLYLFGVVAVITAIWIRTIPATDEVRTENRATLRSCFRLLGNRAILPLVAAIFVVVGIDVAINSNIATYMTEKLHIDPEVSKYGKSVYFAAKMAGTFLGALLLTRIATRRFFLASTLVAASGLILMMVIQSVTPAWIMIAWISLGISNIFPLVFTIAVQRMPDRSNEISGLMMMAISGGAVIPFLVGYAMNFSPEGGMIVLLACTAYLFLIALTSRQHVTA
ncbi:MAG: MFS transporter [Bacteroidales bacterium]